MQHFITLCITAFIGLSVNAQSFTSPESVEYDPVHDRYLVSNSGQGNIVQMDQLGVITAFASGIPSGPYGLEILGNVVYACSGGFVRGFDLTTGAQVFTVNTGGAFLNGITTDGTDLYVTDFGDKKIFKVDVAMQSFSTLVANTNSTPNGIVYDPDFGLGMLWVAFWGGAAPVKGYSTTGAAGPTINTNLTNIDGITRDCLGNLYLASWSPDAITQVAVSNGAFTNMGWTVADPADIDFDEVHSRICIPNTLTNTVILEGLQICSTGVFEIVASTAITVSPNPARDMLLVNGDQVTGKGFLIYDAAMRTAMSGTLQPDALINVAALEPGIYFLRMEKGTLLRFVRADN